MKALFLAPLLLTACALPGESTDYLNTPVPKPETVLDPTPSTPYTRADHAAVGAKQAGGYLGFGALGDAVGGLILAAGGVSGAVYKAKQKAKAASTPASSSDGEVETPSS